MSRLPNSTLLGAIDGLVDWVGNWSKVLDFDPRLVRLWLKLWPIAAEVTNRDAIIAQNVEVRSSEAQQDRRLADSALNTPVGRLMSAFLDMCPNLKRVPKPFEKQGLRQMRTAAIQIGGEARLQVLHRLLMALEYMRKADLVWANRYLLEPLRASRHEEIEIWDAIAENAVLKRVTMRRIGKPMVAMASASALSEETRAKLAERIVFRVLLDRLEFKNPSIADAAVQQMLRVGGDRLRSLCANALGEFVQRFASDRQTPEARFDRVVKPFIVDVWPRERSLLSKSLADSIASLPAKSEKKFFEAVETIERLLSPFDCWSLWEYGLLSDADDEAFDAISGKREARALLKLLDLTIGGEERAVVPYDLDKALVIIQKKDPALVKDLRFRRLSTLTRSQ